jgi:hypothetical protein
VQAAQLLRRPERTTPIAHQAQGFVALEVCPMLIHKPAIAPDQRQSSPELGALGRAARLLDEAQESLSRATDDSAKRTAELMSRIRGLEGNLGEMEQLLIRTEQQASQLANLYVATYQLHASLNAADVRAAIADIAVNLLGAEQFVILVRDDAGRLIPSIDASVSVEAPLVSAAYSGGDSLIDAALADLVPQFGPLPGSDAVVAVPFVAQGETLGVLVVRAFLRHKPGLTPSDRELVDLMGAHAASALLAARAFHVTQRKLSAYEGLLGFMRGGPT